MADGFAAMVPLLPATGGLVSKAVNAATDAAKAVDGAADAAKGTEGVYEVTATSGKTYVGQSKDVGKRLEQHVSGGKVSPDAAAKAKTTPVGGGKTAREVAEQKQINKQGGTKNLENKRNPIGKTRQHLLKDKQ